MSAKQVLQDIEQAKAALDAAEDAKLSVVLDMKMQIDTVLEELAALGEHFSLVPTEDVTPSAPEKPARKKRVQIVTPRCSKCNEQGHNRKSAALCKLHPKHQVVTT